MAHASFRTGSRGRNRVGQPVATVNAALSDWLQGMSGANQIVLGLIIQFPLDRAMRRLQAESAARHGILVESLSGIETVQVIMYAGRAIQLAQELFKNHTDVEFLKRVAAAKSNLQEQGDGARVYERYVKPAVVDLQKVTAHYGITSLFEEQGPRVYCYEVERDDYQVLEAGSGAEAPTRQTSLS